MGYCISDEDCKNLREFFDANLPTKDCSDCDVETGSYDCFIAWLKGACTSPEET